MNTKKLLMLLPLLLVLGLAACDNDNSSNAQDMGEELDPGAEQASTTFSGKVVPPGNSSCTDGIAGIMTGDEIEAVMAPTTGMAGTATVTVNEGTDGMIACTADGSEPENIDSPPVAFIVCKVTMVSSGITGVEVGDVITIDIEFSGQAPEIKEAAIETADGCLLIQLASLNATS
jgi:hypothetical protein